MISMYLSNHIIIIVEIILVFIYNIKQVISKKLLHTGIML